MKKMIIEIVLLLFMYVVILAITGGYSKFDKTWFIRLAEDRLDSDCSMHDESLKRFVLQQIETCRNSREESK